MKKRSAAVNILTGIPAFFLSILLVICLLVSSIYGVVLNCVTPKAINDVVQSSVIELVKSPDFETIILENETVKSNIEELGITTEAVGELMQSEAVTEVVDLLSADFANILTGVEETNLTPEALLNIVTEHADDLAEIAVEMSDEQLDKEQIKQQIVETVERDAEQLTAAMPDVEIIRQTVTEDATVERVLSFLNPTYLWMAYGVCLVLALLIYALRYYHFGGLIWLGVNSIIGGGLMAIIIYVVDTFAISMLPNSLGSARGIVLSVLDRVVQSMQWRMWIYFGMAVLFIGGYVALHILVTKKKLAAANAPAMPEVAPVVTAEAPVVVTEAPVVTEE